MVACMYYDGDGTEQDYKKAVEWYRTAAIQGNQASQYELGIMLLRGQGIDADSDSALEWIKKSAGDDANFRYIKEGNPDAQRVLGIMYMKGYLVPKDLERAFLLIKSSAAKKDIKSIEILASMYYSGKGCEVDIPRAAELYTESAEAGLPESQRNLAHLLANGLGKEKDLGSAIMWNGKALSQFTEQYGIHHAKTISCCNTQAWYLYLANNYDEALSYGQRAVSNFVEDTSAILKANNLDTLADILSVLDRKREALDYYNKSLDCFSLVLSEDDERLERIRSKIQSLL